jgi:hypothetical protein
VPRRGRTRADPSIGAVNLSTCQGVLRRGLRPAQEGPEAGDGFREVFIGEGQVTVAAGKAREFKGHVPEVEPKIFDRYRR